MKIIITFDDGQDRTDKLHIGWGEDRWIKWRLKYKIGKSYGEDELGVGTKAEALKQLIDWYIQKNLKLGGENFGTPNILERRLRLYGDRIRSFIDLFFYRQWRLHKLFRNISKKEARELRDGFVGLFDDYYEQMRRWVFWKV